ncbi:MAG: DUF1501 domain-containing protein [Planctomycetales bacterium]|nr:DUF1501 domain-containing protein [Planctomycetales bacterium]
MPEFSEPGCGSWSHFHRRTLLKAAGLSGMGWLTPVAEALSRASEKDTSGQPPRSVIVLWLAGGPSQLETFDPKPGTNIAAGTEAIKTSVPGIQLAKGYEQLADQMQHISLVRSITSKEGDHERATYNTKTGFRPDPTLVHPSIGAILCHQQKDNIEIPRHVSILPGPWPARGGYLGDQFDAFQINDPQGPIPDITRQVSDERYDRRINDLAIVEREFARGRLKQLDARKTLQRDSTEAALKMMASEQLKAFDVKEAPESVRDQFGDTAFGRGCLAAARLVEVGVRCVEVTLNGWDSHANNHANHAENAKVLDPAFAALIRYLNEHELLDRTTVICGGEFGRTPRINPAGGRDHWPHGFSMALAGGGIAGGRVIGETSPDPDLDVEDKTKILKDPHNIADVHATVLHTLGIEYEKELQTPIGRPMIISQGKAIQELLV